MARTTFSPKDLNRLRKTSRFAGRFHNFCQIICRKMTKNNVKIVKNDKKCTLKKKMDNFVKICVIL